MGLFYIWLKKMLDESVAQELVAFVNREAADEWWRAISTPSGHGGDVRRMSPQLYVQINEGDMFYSKSFSGSHSFTRKPLFRRTLSPRSGVNNFLNDPSTIIPGNEITDHISGRWYFVRSKADPSSHWYLRTNGMCAVCAGSNCDAIHVSSDYRTRFCVQVRNNPEVPEDFVMIGKDEISISALKGYTVYTNDAGDLKAMKEYKGETDLLFGDLKKRFVVRAEKQVNGEVWEYVESAERGVGEIWELVE